MHKRGLSLERLLINFAISFHESRYGFDASSRIESKKGEKKEEPQIDLSVINQGPRSALNHPRDINYRGQSGINKA